MRVLAALLAALALVPVAARAGYQPGGPTPAACTGALWSEKIGTLGLDIVVGAARPERLYGLTGTDWLVGSDTRASCMFGGQGNDVLTLGRGGGVALGEWGRDLLVGSGKTDALSGGKGPDTILAGAAADVLRGGAGVDGFDAADGDDLVQSVDGVAEVVDCGAGADTALADRADVLLGCEAWRLEGRPLARRLLDRARGGRGATFAANFVSPERAPPGLFRVIVAAGGCAQGAIEVARSPALRRGQRAVLRLRPPGGRWCRGAYAGAIVRTPPCPPRVVCGAQPPAEPLAWVAFVIR